MRKYILTAGFLIFHGWQGHCQTQCDFSNHYEDFISIRKTTHNEKDYLIKQVSESNKKSCVSGLVNNNTMFVDYILTNFSSNSNTGELLKIKDSTALHKKYISDLQKDSLFNALMTELLRKTTENSTTKDTVTFDNLLNIAVKYFSIMKLNDEGNYVGKVCAGLNDIKKTETVRKPFIEAFCFSSILKHYRGTEFSMYDEFVKAIRELYKVNLGNDREEKLLRAQGAMFLLMRNNERLKKMLLSEYQTNKAYLPFVLAG